MLLSARTVRVLVPGALAALLAVSTISMAQTAPAPAKPADPAPQTAPAPAKPQDAPKPPDGSQPKGGFGGKHGGGQGGQPHAPPAPGAPPDLGDVMNGLKGDLKALDAAVTAKKTDDAINAVSDMERLVIEAKRCQPENIADKPEADRAAEVVAFRKDLIAMLTQLVSLETEVLDGKFDAASARISGPLMDLRDESHDKYRKHREHGGPGQHGTGQDGDH